MNASSLRIRPLSRWENAQSSPGSSTVGGTGPQVQLPEAPIVQSDRVGEVLAADVGVEDALHGPGGGAVESVMQGLGSLVPFCHRPSRLGRQACRGHRHSRPSLHSAARLRRRAPYRCGVAFTHLLGLADSGSLARGRDYARRGLVQIRSSRDGHVTAESMVPRCTTSSSTPAEARARVRSVCGVTSASTWSRLHSPRTETSRRSPSVPPAPRMTRRAVDAADLKSSVDRLRVRGYLDWRQADAHGERAHDLVDDFESSITKESAPALLPLIERAVDVMIKAILRSDDSSEGDAAARLLRLHVTASAMARPRPSSPPSGWRGSDSGRRLLRDRPRGLRRATRPTWTGGLHAGGRPTARREARRRHSLLARQRLAGWPGTCRRSSSRRRTAGLPYRYQQLVDALLEIGEDDKALTYALEGVTARPNAHQTIPLYDTAARLMAGNGELDRVLELRRQQLDTFPSRRTARSARPRRRSAAGTLCAWTPWTPCSSGTYPTTYPS